MAEVASVKNQIAGCGCLVILALAGVGCLLGPHVGGIILVAGGLVFGVLYSFMTVLTNPDKEMRRNAGCVCFSILILSAIITAFISPVALLVVGIIVAVFLFALWIAKGNFLNQEKKDKEITDKFEAALLASGLDFGIENELEINISTEVEVSSKRRMTIAESVDQLVEELNRWRFTKINRFIANFMDEKPKACKIFEEILSRASTSDADCMLLLTLISLKAEDGEEAGKWLKCAIEQSHSGAEQFLDSLRQRSISPEITMTEKQVIDIVINMQS